MIAWTGGAVIIAAALMLYATSPNQKLLRSTARHPVVWCGAGLLTAGLLLVGQWAGTATAMFITMILAMLIWSIVPLATAWWRNRQGGRS